MESFTGKLAVVTGGAGGMGRELVLQLAAEGCSVATCDLDEPAVRETAALAARQAPDGVRVTAHVCDVIDPRAVERFRDEVLARHETDHVELVFNNAGTAGAGSFLTDDRDAWDRVFNVCWHGVYNCSRAFVPLLVAGDEGCLVNTSSVCGFWGSNGPRQPCTAYSAAKFAVKGFSEALLGDFHLHAPHVKVAVVMPGLVNVSTTKREHVHYLKRLDDWKARLEQLGLSFTGDVDTDRRRVATLAGEVFDGFSPTSAREAATTILDGVRAGRWRILVGDDAHRLDEAVRADPESAYEPDFHGLDLGWFFPMVLLRGLYEPGAASELTAVFELRHRGDRITLTVVDGRLEVVHADPPRPDATLEVDPDTFCALLRGDKALDDALDRGDAEVTGDRAALDRLLAATRGPREPATAG